MFSDFVRIADRDRVPLLAVAAVGVLMAGAGIALRMRGLHVLGLALHGLYVLLALATLLLPEVERESPRDCWWWPWRSWFAAGYAAAAAGAVLLHNLDLG